MANTRSQNRRTRAYRGGNKRRSGSGALFDTVRSTITQVAGGRSTGRGRSTGGGLASKASGLVGGLLGGGAGSRGRRRR